MLRIAYCGVDYYAPCLEALLSDETVQVLKVYTNGEKKYRSQTQTIRRIAEAHNLEVQDEPIGAEEVDRLFNQMGCDYILSASYAYKIPIGTYRGVNIHPTLLPVGRGAWPFPKLILDGYRESGVSIHKLTDRFDAGDIVLQRSFRLDEQETVDSLVCKTQMIGVEMLKEWLTKPDKLWEKAKPQGEGEYWKLLPEEAQTVDCERTPDELRTMLRAFGSSGVFFKAGDRKWILRTVSCQNAEHNDAPGTILFQNGRTMCVAVNGGIIYAANAGEIRKPEKPEKPGFWKRVKRKIIRILSS